jgi:hypothetical protein
MTTSKDSLLNMSHAQLSATLKALERAGASIELMELVRGNKKVAQAMVDVGKTFLPSKWTIDDEGIIHIDLPVTTGITGPEWSKMLNTSKWADDLLNSDDFQATTGKIYKIAIIPGKFFSDKDRTMANIRKEIDRRKWSQGSEISSEIACLLRRHLSDQDIADLGLYWLITMHEPIKDSDGDPSLLSMNRSDDDILDTDSGHPGNQCFDDNGFVCVVLQES